MIYRLFVYKASSGLLLWEKSFEAQEDNVELFSSFFSAIQLFVKQIVVDDSQNQKLHAIDLGEYMINITKIIEIDADIVIIADKDDSKPLKKILPKLLKIVFNHKELFDNWDGDQTIFDVLDLEILQLLKDNKKLLGERSLTENRKEILNKILDDMPELEKEQKEKYKEEIKFLRNRFKKSDNLFRKLELLDSMDKIAQKLKNKEEIEYLQHDRSKILRELEDIKFKLTRYLHDTKSTISEIVEKSPHSSLYDLDFKDVYLKFYSFSSKLRFIGRNDLSEEFRSMAKNLIDKPPEKEHEFSLMIRRMLNLSDDINDYIPGQ
ncbi:MAG: hypothetical protein ACTSVU_00975 [Promethearchaeota archaeon]